MKSRRRGYNLIECSVVITLLAATFGAIVPILHTLYRADHRMRDRLAHAGALERLADQLRSDAHVALAAAVDSPAGENAPPSNLSLSLPGEQTIQYSILPERIERVVRQAGALEHRETYRLAFSPASRWEVQQDRKPPLVSLILEPPADHGLGQVVPLQAQRIDAAVQLVPARLRAAAP